MQAFVLTIIPVKLCKNKSIIHIVSKLSPFRHRFLPFHRALEKKRKKEEVNASLFSLVESIDRRQRAIDKRAQSYLKAKL